jgi:hypothetical protein
VLVGAVVVKDHVELEIDRNGLINQAQELESFLMSMPLLAQTEHLAVGSIEGCEQRRRPIRL